MVRNMGLLFLSLLLLIPAAVAADNPLIGTWKINVAKSKFFPGPPPKSRTEIYESSGPNGIKWTDTHVSANGKTEHLGFTAKFDGKYYPFFGAPQLRDQVAIKQIGPRAFRFTYKKAGEVVQINFATVTPDGKTLIYLASTMSAEGKPLSNVNFYDKQ